MSRFSFKLFGSELALYRALLLVLYIVNWWRFRIDD